MSSAFTDYSPPSYTTSAFATDNLARAHAPTKQAVYHGDAAANRCDDAARIRARQNQGSFTLGCVDDSRGRTRSALPRRPAHTDYQRDSYGVGEDRDDTA